MSDAGVTLQAADIAVIIKALPHRYPFLMIDRIINISGDESGIGIKNVTANEPQFQGHFPDNPVFPGVLMIEGMAQTAGVMCILTLGDMTKKSVFFLTIDNAKFRKPVIPGDTIEYHMKKKVRKRQMWWFHGEARVAGQIVAEADVGAAIVVEVNPMSLIDPTARIADGAVIAPEAVIGPFCVVGPNVVIGEGCRLLAHVHVTGHTSIGSGTVVYPFASLGSPPQSVKYRGGPTRLVIGSGCDIREGVTMNTGTEDANGETRVGDRCLFMVSSHVGHDCIVGNDVTFANNAVLGGHVVVGDKVFFGGQSAVHQFVRIGEGAMIAGLSGASEDVIPFGFVHGTPAGNLVGLNIVGLRRRGVSRADMHRLRRAYRLLFYGQGRFSERADAIAVEFEGDPVVGKIVAFVRDGGSRPLMKARSRAAVVATDAKD